MPHQIHHLCLHLIFVSELSMKLSPHLSGLSHLLDTMQLPSSEYEDLGSYFFSSAIAIRKLLSRVTDLVSYSSAFILYAELP